MKKQSLLLITGGILAFASCNTDTAATADNSQAKIDSMVNERVEMIRAELEAKNDSIINEMAIYRADSIMAAMTGKKAPVRKPAAAPKDNTIKEEAAETPKGGIKSKADDNKPSGSESLKSKSDQNQKSGSSKLKDRADK